MTKWVLGLAGAMACTSIAPQADAFCGFYVAGAEAELYNDATMVVMMREGPQTVLSMQNTYQGPAEDFAMVVPVPVVLQEEDVKTLSDETFDHVDRLSAPRLVEYWERDPCDRVARRSRRALAGPAGAAGLIKGKGGGASVRIEAQFEVGEYEIVILSADDSAALETWLKDHDYAVPDGAGPLLRPYVQDGSKFFVAKVDVEKVRFGDDGRAQLSPLRFHYESEDLRLPVRLGLVNSRGTQDLLVHVLGRERYQAANYENITIPTNLDVTPEMREKFGAFYAALFDHTIDKHPKAAVTEYAWAASSCDPCPTSTLSPSEVEVLGDDVIDGVEAKDLVLTRLHLRYDASSLGEDLVLEAAPAIEGGRERMRSGIILETVPTPGSFNNFQARYAIRHPWEGPITCKHPIRGRWGGSPPDGKAPGGAGPAVARDLAFADRDAVKLTEAVRHDVPEIDLKAADAAVSHPGKVPAPAPAASAPVKPAKYQPPRRAGCTCEVDGARRESDGGWAWLFAGVALLRRRRKG